MKNILLIEDDPRICEVVTDYFTDKGTKVTAVSDGNYALGLISEGLEDYGLVLLDIMLPGADGFTICRELRKKSDIPVIFITAMGREEDGEAKGVDIYQFLLQESSFICYSDKEAFFLANDFDYPGFSLSPGTEREFIIPFGIISEYNDIERLENKDTKLVISLYPNKKMVNLNQS